MSRALVNFSAALEAAKKGLKIAREQFRDTCYIMAQYPDENSKMTKPYLYMVKGEERFPVDLSCESIFAEDWYKIEAAQKAADEAKATAEGTITQAKAKVVNFLAEQFVGQDPELRKKLDEAYGIIEEGRKAKGMDIRDDKAIQEMMTMAASMSGISAPAQVNPVFPMNGGMAPNFQKTEGEISEAEHDAFLTATGYEKPKPTKQE